MSTVFHPCIITDELPLNFDDALRCIKEYGITDCELRMVQGSNLAVWSRDDCRSLLSQITNQGLHIACIASPLFKWCWRENPSYLPTSSSGMMHSLSVNEKRCLIKNTLENASVLNVRLVRVFSYLGQVAHPVERLTEDALWIEAVHFAEELGITLLLENETFCWIHDSSDLVSFSRYARRQSNVGLLFDFGNYVASQDSSHLSVLLQEIGSEIRHVHLKDGNRGNGFSSVAIGRGDYGCAQFLAELSKYVSDQRIAISLEPHLTSICDNQQISLNAIHASMAWLADRLCC